MSACLQIDALHVALRATRRAPARLILRGIDLAWRAARSMPRGESGAGKSMVSRTVLGINPVGTQVVGGEIGFLGMDWLRLAPAQRRQHLGRDVALIPQDPLTALNPGHPIGQQVGDVLRFAPGQQCGAGARADVGAARGGSDPLGRHGVSPVPA